MVPALSNIIKSESNFFSTVFSCYFQTGNNIPAFLTRIWFCQVLWHALPMVPPQKESYITESSCLGFG